MEDPGKIFDYLPISKLQAEDDYIRHLWKAFLKLEQSVDEGQGFALMPFHLLFMLAVQYKILRVATEYTEKYKAAFLMTQHRDKNIILNPGSVFDVALLNERSMVDIFRLLGADDSITKRFKYLIDYRNDSLAHAKGDTGLGMEEKIEEYFRVLEELQSCMKPLNDIVASTWLSEMAEEDDPFEFTQLRLGPSYLCGADFKSGLLEQNQVRFFRGEE